MSTIPRCTFRAGLKPKLYHHSKPAFHVVRRMSTQPQFSTSYDPAQGQKDIENLLKGNGGKWRLTENGKGLERPFRFKGFKKCWNFMNEVADECVRAKHHPEWSNVYNTTFVRWTTHSPPGLSEKDVLMARFCDEAAGKYGEVEPLVETEQEGDVGKGLVDQVAVVAGDCCVPKSMK
ncbi:transcriptional coactivator/pterin dehydratase [Tricladium varicosporioides]|nr:transcriptional coactivator/pterin dehydratase [Hymenoscyphus varicosporioides]